MSHLAIETSGCSTQWYRQRRFERVVHIAGAVAGEHHDRRPLGTEHAELGHGDLEVAEHFEQVRLELVVGSIDLVDQQHRGRSVDGLDRAQEGPLEQEPLLVQLTFEGFGADALGFTAGLGGAAGAAVGGCSPSRTPPG